jgi:lysophospholipase L1-like esterase
LHHYLEEHMRVLFIGDSLVKGKIGVNWVRLLANRHKSWRVENAGVSGETISKISCRLKKKLRVCKDYDFIVLLAGANDILIPTLERRGFFFRRTYRYLLRKGNKPLKDPTAFGNELRTTISYIHMHTKAAVVLSTISCLSEDLEHPLNARRREFNNVIREIAIETGSRLADTAALCDGCLQCLTTRNYFLDNFFNTACFDKMQSLLPGGVDAISRKRELHLTIDGIHVNSQGARYYIDEIEKQVY